MVLSLPVRLRYNRERLKLSLRTAAEQIGIAFNTLTRIEHGEQYTEEIMIKILVWLIGAEKLSTPE
jgi:transcriptional regulator with XRE-family HTH domain